MIIYHKADLFTTPDKIIAHGCNAMGVMGSGVAKLIKEKYPEAFKEYRLWYEANDENGLPLGYNQTVICSEGVAVVNMITQHKYSYDGVKCVSYDAVDACMSKLARKFLVDTPISMPKIGAGLGGGNWEVIEAIINHRLKNHTINVYYLD